MPEKSCLTCKYGKPEKQPAGYYCKLPTWIRATYHREILPSCIYYKPRLNQCELDGCEYMDEVCQRGDSIVGLHPRFIGKKCQYFKEKEDIVGKFEFEGKTYEQTGKSATLHNLFFAAQDCPDAIKAIWEFSHKLLYFNYNDKISLGSAVVNHIQDNPGIIPWLVEKGYLVEVVEEVKQLPDKWYRGKETGDLFYSDEQLHLIRMQSKGFDMGIGKNMVDFGSRYSKIDPPTITEQPDKARKFPTTCLHHKQKGCLNGEAIKHFGAKDSVNCSNRVPDGCPAYNNGKVERRPKKRNYPQMADAIEY